MLKGAHRPGLRGTLGIGVLLAAALSAFGPVAQASGRISGKGNVIAPVEGTMFSSTVATFTDSNAGDSPSNLVATIDWGDGTTDSGAPVSGSSGNFSVSGTHTYADECSCTITTTLRQQSPGTDSGVTTGTATVGDAEGSSSFVANSISATEGTEFSGKLASLTTGYANVASDFTATVKWGDGTTSAATVVQTGSGMYELDGSHTYLDECACTFTVTVADDAPGTFHASEQGAATVAEGDFGGISPQTLSGVEGSQQFTIIKFTNDFDKSASDWTASIDWGDGVTTSGEVVRTSPGHYSVLGTHSYEEGSYMYRVTVGDDPPSTLSFVDSGGVTIAEGDLQGSVAFTATEGRRFAGRVATFTDNAASTVAGDYQATINWGDGTVSAGLLSGSGGSFVVGGSHTYREECNCNAKVTIARIAPSALSISPTAPVAVGDAQLSGSVMLLPSARTFNGTIAQFTDANPLSRAQDFTATINWGDGSKSSRGRIRANGTGTFDVRAVHRWRGRGPFTATIRIVDDGGASTRMQALKPSPPARHR